MKQITTIKEIHNFKYYTGAHPEIKAHYRAGKRPTEFGNKIWATSLVLLNYLQQNPFDLHDLRVLEIGCGWGLLGVYLSKIYSCQVTCTDMDEYVLPIVQLHAELNDVSIKIQQATFNDLSPRFLKNFDLIIGSEICYSEEVAKDIIQLIQRAFEANVGHILIADPGRPDFHDCHSYCVQHFKTELIQLPGSINGKTTQAMFCTNHQIKRCYEGL